MELAALVQQLRGAANAQALAKAVDASLELLVSSPSLATAQRIVSELRQLTDRQLKDGSLFTQRELLARLKMAAAICAAPASKAEFLGYALAEQIFGALDSHAVGQQTQAQTQQYQEMFTDAFIGNRSVLPGVLAVVESKRSPLFSSSSAVARRAFQMIAPLCDRILTGAEETCQSKLALLHVLQRIAWHTEHADVTLAITRSLVAALGRSPRHTTDATPSYSTLVSVLVDLLVASDETLVSSKLIASVCDHIVVRVELLMAHECGGALQLLQWVVQLAEFAPEALWESRFLVACAHVLVANCDRDLSLEKQLLLSAVSAVLSFGETQLDASPTRGAYVECLVVPLLSALATHAEQVSPLLQLTMNLKARRQYVPGASVAVVQERLDPEEQLHADALLHLMSNESACLDWLPRLFVDSSSELKELDQALLMGTLLFDNRRSLRDGAISAFERQVQGDAKQKSKHWRAATTKLLVSSFVFAVSQQQTVGASASRHAAFVSRAFFVLASLAATTTDTMKIILKFIKRMNTVASMQPIALRLLYVVWERESRVYPRLEALLHQEVVSDSSSSSSDYELVKIATIEALCRKDPELGVEYIRQIQAFLEDERASAVAMAVNAVEALCNADCLDFYAVFKIISLKVKKSKIRCIDAPLVLERLCVFYALGASEMDGNKKQAMKLLEHLWELTANTSAGVRERAFASLNVFSLEALRLCVSSEVGGYTLSGEARGNGGAEDEASDDEDVVTEDDVAEKIDELIEVLAAEQAAGVRTEIGNVLTRVLELESKSLHAGNDRKNRKRKHRVEAIKTALMAQ